MVLDWVVAGGEVGLNCDLDFMEGVPDRDVGEVCPLMFGVAGTDDEVAVVIGMGGRAAIVSL